MPTKEQWIILLLVEIFNKFKKFKYHWIQKFTSNTDLRKQYFLSEEKISDRSCFVDKDLFYLTLLYSSTQEQSITFNNDQVFNTKQVHKIEYFTHIVRTKVAKCNFLYS